MPQSNHRKKGGGINEREPSAFIAYTYDSKTMPPCKIQSAKQKVLDEITGFARSRHPVKVYCYQWTTSNFIERGPGVEPGFGAATPTMLLQKHRFRTNPPPKRESIRPPSYSAVYESPFGMLSKFVTSVLLYLVQSSTQTSSWHLRKTPQRHNC